jgi:hypothetical protein
MRMSQGELHPDHASHRQAHEVSAVDFERVEQTGDVVSHVRDGVRVIGSGAATGIAVVEEDDTEPGGELWDLLPRP